MVSLNYKELLNYHRRKDMPFSQFVDRFVNDPTKFLYNSSTLIAEAIKYFGYKIVVRNGEPVLSFNIFKDIFSNGINAVYGQEFCIKKIFDVIESISKESGPNRGIVLVGPPASGKTNIVDLVCLALEQYSKEESINLYSFYYHFEDTSDPSKVVEIRSPFIHSPILFFTTILKKEGGISRPRAELFNYINSSRPEHEKFFIPNYYQNATLDKRNLDIVDSLILSPRNKGKSLFDILEEYVRVEEIEFSNGQAIGISNIDDMKKLSVDLHPVGTREEAVKILNQHLPTKLLYQYEGALVSSNRGILHIHDAFENVNNESDYKPLLMLLGSGKISLESTQTSLDTVVVITTNIEDMEQIDKQLTSSKLLDRIEKVPVNYLLDSNSEIDILKRDMAGINEKYDVDPNLFRVASHFSVMTRLLPPVKKDLPHGWSDAKKDLYRKITPEQKLFLYSSLSDNPLNTIKQLPYWHPFRNEAYKLGINLNDEKLVLSLIEKHPGDNTVDTSCVFSRDEMSLLDDEFKRELWMEHYLKEGTYGISIRQLQNIMRNTISNSDGRMILVSSFISELALTVREGSQWHHWLSVNPEIKIKKNPIHARKVGKVSFKTGEGEYGNYTDMVKLVEAIYLCLIETEIIAATVDRDPARIEYDLRKYVQNVLLAQAIENKAFSHIMVPKFTFLDPVTGQKNETPDTHYMGSIENIIAQGEPPEAFRRKISQIFFEAQSSGKISLDKGKSVINSKDDNFLTCFEREQSRLLSHRRENEGIDGDRLTQAIFQKKNETREYEKNDLKIINLIETILRNMCTRYGYSKNIALSTIIFALHKGAVDFKQILN